MKERLCELCKEKASLYCASDSAFLCWKCDATVHNANFLVARHRRRLLCFNCNSFAGVHISGASSRRTDATCRSCSPTEIHSSDEEEEEEDDNSLSSSPPSSSSSSSACVSSSEPRAGNKIRTKHLPEKRIRTVTSSGSAVTTDDDDFSTAKQKRQRNNKKKNSNGGGSGSDEVRTASAKEYSVFAKWSEELGLGLNEGRRVSCVACRALRVWVRKWKGVGIPYKVGAATSFWLGLRFCGMTFENLRRLEEISGVPAKLILQAYAMLSRVFFFSQQQQTTSTPFFHLQEGSDES